MKNLKYESLKRKFTDVNYNGDLGVLQHTTKSNLKTIDLLEDLEEINHEQWKELRLLIVDYFKQELEHFQNNLICNLTF